MSKAKESWEVATQKHGQNDGQTWFTWCKVDMQTLYNPEITEKNKSVDLLDFYQTFNTISYR